MNAMSGSDLLLDRAEATVAEATAKGSSIVHGKNAREAVSALHRRLTHGKERERA